MLPRSFLKKIGVTKRLRSLNPGEAIVMVLCPIVVHFISWCTHRCTAWRANLRELYGSVVENLLRTSLISFPSTASNNNKNDNNNGNGNGNYCNGNGNETVMVIGHFRYIKIQLDSEA